MKHKTSVATLIGDVVESRAVSDRLVLHDALGAVIEAANGVLQPLVALRITVGDEFQGCFATLGQALHATLWLRLRLAPVAQLRHGVGWGGVAVLADQPRVEDGPGWWAAREAIESVKAEAERSSARRRRTAYRRAAPGGGPPVSAGSGHAGSDPDAVNAALMCQDQMVGSLSARSLRLLGGTLEGRTQAELAESEQISASAVSQRMRHDGLAVILAADELLRGVR